MEPIFTRESWLGPGSRAFFDSFSFFYFSLFVQYGKIPHIDLKVPPRRAAYAFVEYEDLKAAEDAVRGRDGYTAFPPCFSLSLLLSC